jgi:hypothetical protein
MADRKISDLTALTTPASGDYLPIVDISEAAAASKNKRITIEELMRGVPDGTAAAPGIAFETYPSTGIYSSGANQLAVSTGGTGRLFITSAGLVGIGTSAPGALLDLRQPTSASEQEHLRIVGGQRSSDGFAVGVRILTGAVSSNSNRHLRIINSGNTIFQHYETSSNTPVPDRHILLCPDGGNVGIGVTSPGSLLHLAATGTSTNAEIIIAGTNTNGDASCQARIGATQDGALTSAALTFSTRLSGTNSEKARLDSSGRLLIGTSSAANNYKVFGTSYAPQVQLVSTAVFGLAVNRTNGDANISIANSSTAANNGTIGRIIFNANDGASLLAAAHVTAEVDGTPGANDMPGRLVFSTTADGASSPTERMRIKSAGTINFSNVSTYADNTAALAGGLVAGDVYRKSDGTLMITY